MRRVRIAVGLPSYTWCELHLEVEEDPDYILENDEVEERALAIAKSEFSGEQVSFFLVTYVEPPDYMDGII